MTRKQWIVLIFMSLMVGASFYPVFNDPFHEKTDLVCFWEMILKEIWELIHGEKTT